MGNLHLFHRRRWGLTVAAMAALLAAGWAAPLASAGPLDKLDTSLQWLPADAAFYSSSLRLGEQVQIVAKSRAWASLKALPAVQKALGSLDEAAKGSPQGAMAKAFMDNPEVRKGLAFLGDMFANEVFVYADPAAIDVAELFQALNGARSMGQVTALVSGKHTPSEMNRVQATTVFAALAENIELLKVPNVIVGFRVKNRDLAVEQLGKLSAMINFASMATPQIGSLVKSQKVGQSDYLTFSVNGGMIPWDTIPLDMIRGQLGVEEGDFYKVVEKIKKTTFVAALGLRKDYVLLAIGPSTDCLAKLGQGKRLIELEEMKKLERFADARIASVGYVSKAVAERLAFTGRDVDDLAGAVDALVKQANLSEDLKTQIHKDAQELAKDLKGFTQKAGAIVSVSLLTDRGVESYAYHWGETPFAQNAQPLEILKHLGGRPILALAAGASGSVKEDLQGYEFLVKLLKMGHRYAETYAVPQMDSDAREVYKKATELFRPLLARLDETTRKKLIPATAAGEGAFVLDARLKSRQFLKALPATEKPMPMIEPAMVLGIKDSKLLASAMGDYREIFNDAVDAVRKLAPPGADIPDLKIPKPQSTQTSAGTLYYYAAPDEWGLDGQIALNFGLSDKLAVVAASNRHAERLLTATPLSVGGVLGDTSRPLLSAGLFDWAGLVDAATPWIELGVREAVRQNPEIVEFLGSAEGPKEKKPAGKKPEAKKAGVAKADVTKLEAKKVAAKKGGMKQPAVKAVAKKSELRRGPTPTVMDQVHTVLNALKTFRTITAVSYVEDGVLVQHSLVEVRDIDAPAEK